MTYRNCFTNDKTGKRSPVVNCSWVKWTTLSSSPTVEKVGPSDNYKLMPSRTLQKDLNSSKDIEATRLLAVGDSQLDPFLRLT